MENITMSQQAIQDLLQKFQDGYAQRDPARIDTFMDLVVTSPDLEVIGTNAIKPDEGEWCRGPEAVRELILGDWEHWGDVVFDWDGATIFVRGEVAWMATTATVTDVITVDYKYDGFVGFAESVLEEKEMSAKEKLLDITRLGNNLIASLLWPDTYVWPFRLTGVAVKEDEQWRFHHLHFSFATTEAPDVRNFPDIGPAEM